MSHRGWSHDIIICDLKEYIYFYSHHNIRATYTNTYTFSLYTDRAPHHFYLPIKQLSQSQKYDGVECLFCSAHGI